MARTQVHDDERILSTLNVDGSRRWIRPKPSRGRYWKRRRAVAYGLIAMFTALPHIPINGKPAVLLNVAQREFTILGTTFYPTDTLLLALLMVGVFLAVFLLTAIFGRVWCGWGCPQTVYMEWVYRPIERFLEGEPGGKRGVIKDPGVAKALKYAAFFVVSCFLAHTFLSYFVGVAQLRTWMTRSPLEHPSSFIIMAAVTGLMMVDFAFFREQICLLACPYGRFQSVLLDRGSLIVGYDRRRGEPRGKLAGVGLSLTILPGGAAPAQGDCIDCFKCVTTCPTGIDIRNGLQLECIHCTQCVDACDAVMDKIGKPRGLIRYASQSALDGETRRGIRPRVVFYPAMLLVVIAAFVVVLVGKGTADFNVVRGIGRPFNVLPTGDVANQLRVKIVNRDSRERAYTLTLEGVEGALRAEANPVVLAPGKAFSQQVTVIMPMATFGAGHMVEAVLRARDGASLDRPVTIRLLGPESARTRDDAPSSHETEEDSDG
jgi:cytochrome c oxidase accessory protein FixG